MSQIISPPDIYFNGINFNSSFYAEDAAGFTESQANALYLRKTVTDTATALETFNGGLATTTLKTTGSSNMLNSLFIRDALTSATNTIYFNPNTPNYPYMSLFSPFNSLTIYIESPSNTANIQVINNKTLNIATSATDTTLNIGTGPRTTAVVHHYSDGDNAVAGSNVYLNNGVSNLSNTAIHNGANSIGALNLATGLGSSTAISIGTNGATATANRIRIGSATRQTYLDSDSLNMGTNGLTGSGAISIATGTNIAGAQVSIGSVSLSALNLRGVQTNVESTTLNLNTNGAGNTLIGTSGGSNSITLNRPITPAYPFTITTGTGNYPFTTVTTMGTISNVGYCYYVPLVTVSSVTFNNVQTTRQVLTGVPKGVYQVSYTASLASGNCSGFQGFIVTGLNFTNNSTTFPSGYNYYQTGYSQITGYTVAVSTAISGSCAVFIQDGSNHNTIAIVTQYESVGGAQVGSINTSMSVVRIA